MGKKGGQSFEKRQRELAKQRKRREKKERRVERKIIKKDWLAKPTCG